MNRLTLFFLLLSSVGAMAQSTEGTEKDSIDWDLLLEDVVVTATYAPTKSQNAIHDIRVVDRVDIEKLQARNLEQLLIADASMRIQADAQIGTNTSLLGIGGQNVKIMIDGVPVIGRLNGNIDLSQLHLNNVEQVEIVEGPLSVNYGTDALAGVINIITKKSQLDRYELQVDAAIEERGEQTLSAHFGVRPTDKWFVKLHGGYDDFKGFDPDTTRDDLWNPKTQIYGGGILRFLPNDRHDFKYSYDYLDETVLSRGNVRLPQFKPYALDESFRTVRHDHVLHYDGNYGKGWYLRAFAAYNSFSRTVDAWRKNFITGEEIPQPTEQDTNFIESWNARATLSFQPRKGKVQFQLGSDSRYDRNIGDRVIFPGDSSNSAYIIDQAFFGSMRYLPNEHLTLEGGVRYAYNNRFETVPVPSVNIRYQLNENWTFRGSYGRGFRSPDIKELYFNFIDVNHYIVGNPNLRPESSDNFQMGITYYRKFRDQEVTFGLKGFHNNIKDQIDIYEYVETPDGIKPAVDTMTGVFAYFNQDRFMTSGLSSRLGLDVRRWRVRVGYTLTGFYNPELEGLPGDNEYSFANEASLNGQYVIPGIETEFNVLVRYYDRLITYYPDFTDQGEEIVGQQTQEGYTMVDLYLGKSIWSERVKLTAGVRNLLDIQTTQTFGSTGGTHTGSSATRLISPGRRFFASMTFNLAWD